MGCKRHGASIVAALNFFMQPEPFAARLLQTVDPRLRCIKEEDLRILMKFATVLALAVPLLAAQSAWAATYKLPIEGGRDILKIFLDNGVARRVGGAGDAALFEVDMDGDQCVAQLRITFSLNAPTLRTRYNVCGEQGFGLTLTRQRW